MDPVTRVKICGITRAEDAELAAALGAWALGFILWPQSKRHVEEAVAAGIARLVRRRVELVGVFVNPTLDEVSHAVDAIGLTHVQLHGDEGPSFATEISPPHGREGHQGRARGGPRRPPGAGALPHRLPSARHGRRGRRRRLRRSWDWSLAAERRSKIPMILSGGLTADNVADGIAQVGPYAVDVASGVESEPGIKDHAKLEAFLAIAAPARAGIS